MVNASPRSNVRHRPTLQVVDHGYVSAKRRRIARALVRAGYVRVGCLDHDDACVDAQHPRSPKKRQKHARSFLPLMKPCFAARFGCHIVRAAFKSCCLHFRAWPFMQVRAPLSPCGAHG